MAAATQACQRTPFAPANLGDLLEDMPQTFYYLKDRDGRWRHCNALTLELLGARSVADIVGLTDVAFWPGRIAGAIMADDADVVASGRAIRGKPETITDQVLRPVRVQTTKVPARDAEGRICGVIGVTRVLAAGVEVAPPPARLRRALACLEAQLAGPVSVAEIAAAAGLSPGQLRRAFQRDLQTTPQACLGRLRALRAARLLRATDRPLAAIAAECGFFDQSHMTRQFRRIFGETPGRYRAR